MYRVDTTYLRSLGTIDDQRDVSSMKATGTRLGVTFFAFQQN